MAVLIKSKEKVLKCIVIRVVYDESGQINGDALKAIIVTAVHRMSD